MYVVVTKFNPVNAKLIPICHLLAFLGAHLILHVSRIRVNIPLFLRYEKRKKTLIQGSRSPSRNMKPTSHEYKCAAFTAKPSCSLHLMAIFCSNMSRTSHRNKECVCSGKFTHMEWSSSSPKCVCRIKEEQKVCLNWIHAPNHSTSYLSF